MRGEGNGQRPHDAPSPRSCPGRDPSYNSAVSLHRRHRRFLLWLAMLAVAFTALAPAVSHALASASGRAGWVEVCTAHGTQWVAADGNLQTDPAESLDRAMNPCTLCQLSGAGWAPPPAPLQQGQAPALRSGPPARFLSAARTAHAWCAAQPRAPPTVS